MKLSRSLVIGAALAMCTTTAALSQNLRGAGGASQAHPSTTCMNASPPIWKKRAGAT